MRAMAPSSQTLTLGLARASRALLGATPVVRLWQMLKMFAAGFAAWLSLAAVSLAWAHAEPANVKPGQDAVLTTSPAAIVIVMSQEMARTAGSNDIVVQDSTGATVTKQPAAIDDADRKKLSVSLPAGLPPGTYTVRWRTVSADDGDPASGNCSFKIDPAGTPSAGKEAVREDVLGVATPVSGSDVPAATASTGSGGGTSWVLLVAVGVAMFALGAGGSFFLVQKRE